MKILIASDLHYGHSAQGDLASACLADHVCSVGQPEDILVLAGDQAGDDRSLRRCLRLFAGFAGRRLAIAGNHDIWVSKSESRDSWQRYRALSGLFQEEGFRSLEDQPQFVGGLALVGSMGWYDYSFAHGLNDLSLAVFQNKYLAGPRPMVWGDGWYVRWPFSDQKMTEIQAARLEAHLRETIGARERIVVMHHLPTSSLLMQPRWLVPRHWRFANTYLGSERFGRLIEDYANIPTLVVAGHIHRRKTVRHKAVTYTSIGGDYRRKELLVREANGHCRRLVFG